MYVIYIFYSMNSVILVFWLSNLNIHMFYETRYVNGFEYITLFFVPRLAWSMYHCRGGLNGEWMQKCNIKSKYKIYLSSWFALPELVSSWALYQRKAWQTYLYKNDICKYSLKLADYTSIWSWSALGFMVSLSLEDTQLGVLCVNNNDICTYNACIIVAKLL